MSEQIEIEIIIDDSDFKESHKEILETVDDDHKLINEVEQRSAEAFNRVLNMARSSYIIGLGMVRAMGGSVTYMFRSMVSGMFATIHALKAVALGKAMTTQDWFSFAMEMGQLGLAISATILAEQKQQELARTLMGAKMSLMGLQQLIGVMSF